jgi:hypothetical protein
VLLGVERIELVEGPERTVVFKAGIDDFGDVAADLEVGRKLEAALGIRALERAIDGGIKRKLPMTELLSTIGRISQFQSALQYCRRW